MIKDINSQYIKSSYTNREKLFTYYKSNLNTSKLLFNKKVKKYLYCSILLLSLAVVGIFFTPLILKQLSNTYAILLNLLCIFMILLSLRFSTKSTIVSNEYILKEYPYYESLINKKSKKYSKEVLTALRCDRIANKLDVWKIDYNEIDEFIQYYSSKSADLKATKWYPIALWAIFAFPVYNECLVFLYTKVSDLTDCFYLTLKLLVLATILTFIVMRFKKIIEIFILIESDNYRELANVLKIVKTYFRET